MVGWGQEGTEGPGGDTVTQAVLGSWRGGTDETSPDRGTRVGQQAGDRGGDDGATKPPYIWVGALGDGGEGEVVVVQLGWGAVSAGGGRGERGGETWDITEHPPMPPDAFRGEPDVRGGKAPGAGGLRAERPQGGRFGAKYPPDLGAWGLNAPRS